MKHLSAALLMTLLGLSAASAQTLPPAPPSSLQGAALRDWLRQNWYDGRRVELSYSDARGRMYNYVDVVNDQLTCVYSGYTVPKPIDSTSVSTANVGLINCEHSIPQSWFNEAVRMRTDIHHLYPTYTQWNSNRGSDRFAEIPDAQTTLWMRNTTGQSTIPPASTIAEWSEDSGPLFEPREDHKGNLARAAFYFYTMHAGQNFDAGKDVITALADLNTLYQWHLADPVDNQERVRNRRAAKVQGNFNPYIVDPTLVARAWGFAPVGPTVTFAAATGSAAEGNSGTSSYTTTLTVAPAPTAALTVQVAVDATGSTASSPADYAFTTQTVTFAAGQTQQTVQLTVNGDTQPEADETVRLLLQNASTGLSIGAPNAHVLTIRNDDGQPPLVSFAAATGSIAEGNSGPGTYTVNVTLSGATPTGSFTVPVSVDAAGSTANATDFALSTTTLSFGTGVSSLPVQVTISGDADSEPNETVRLVLGTPSGGGVAVGPPAAHVLTITNDDAPAPGGGNCAQLFFSEYVESSGTTRAIEIYNPTASAINLSTYRLLRYANGSRTPQAPFSLSGSIAAGGTYVVATPGSAPAVLTASNAQSTVVDFNGDDAMALFNGTDTLDIIGVIGQQTNWTVPGGGTTLNNTLIRRPAVGAGSTRWATAAAGWQATTVDNFTDLGRHTNTACTTTAAAQVRRAAAGLEVFPNPASGTVQLRLPGLNGPASASIGLFDALGREVLRTTGRLDGAAAASVALPALPAGVYSVRVLVNGVSYHTRLAVQP